MQQISYFFALRLHLYLDKYIKIAFHCFFYLLSLWINAIKLHNVFLHILVGTWVWHAKF